MDEKKRKTRGVEADCDCRHDTMIPRGASLRNGKEE
jgi:hypothetical protein